MTRDDNIERVLEQWLAEGPLHMSDRLFDGTFERIERLPKRRLADIGLRLPTMNLNLRLALTTAVVVAVAGVGLAVVNLRFGIAASSSPTAPTQAPTEILTQTESLVPTYLLGAWGSFGTREDAYSGRSASETFEISPNGLSTLDWLGYPDEVNAAAVAGDRLIVRLLSGFGVKGGRAPSAGACPVGAQGTYAWNVSPGGVRLSLQLLADECPARAAILAGDWIQGSCPDGNSCLGDLDPGTYEASTFQPFQFWYTVPAGWVNRPGEGGSYALAPAWADRAMGSPRTPAWSKTPGLRAAERLRSLERLAPKCWRPG